MPKKKLLGIVINNYNNVRYGDFVVLLNAFGFVCMRTRGSHNIYRNHKIKRNINAQNVQGQAKGYQIRQFLAMVEEFQLVMED